MTMIEALKLVYENDDSKDRLKRVWARPLSWKGIGRAIGWYSYYGFEHCGKWAILPILGNGATNAPLPPLSEIEEEWEIVNPDIVNDEMCQLKKGYQ